MTAKLMLCGLLLVLGLGYAAATLVMMGILPERLFAASIIAGASASLLMLALFFHPWLTIGVLLDLFPSRVRQVGQRRRIGLAVARRHRCGGPSHLRWQIAGA